jgi:spore coat protein U-like protein
MSRALKIAAAAAASAACAITALAQTATQDVQVSATVGNACTINGQSNPAAINTTIPVDALGQVDTTQQVFTIPNVVCNTPTDLLATSMNGGVRSASPAPKGFTNIINYRGVATYGTAKSIINTAGGGAKGPEAGNVDSTSSATNGNLVIRVTPRQPGRPLVSGTDYEDTLRVTLTPQ